MCRSYWRVDTYLSCPVAFLSRLQPEQRRWPESSLKSMVATSDTACATLVLTGFVQALQDLAPLADGVYPGCPGNVFHLCHLQKYLYHEELCMNVV